jgi:membrane protease YdiL (CAAX protease family)
LRDLTISIAFGILTAIFEEVLFRGIIFRLIEGKLGSYIALIISSMIFGFGHLMNGNGSFFVVFAITITSILITAAYMYARNLWFPIAIHFAWNFAQGDIFGTAVSGDPVSTSIIVSKLEGSEWFTGGIWGIEASVQIVIFSWIAGIILLALSHRKKNVMKQQVF